MFSLEWDFISRFPLQGLVRSPWWVPMLSVSCVDQWADLIWADPSDALLSPFFADAHSHPTGHPVEPQEACISILLIATNTYTAAVFSPADGLLSKQRLSGGAVTMRQFPDESKHLITSANISWANAIKTNQQYDTSNCRFHFKHFQSKVVVPVICSHLCWLSLTFILTLAPLGVVGPEPLSLKSY